MHEQTTPLLSNGPADAPDTLILAHGAGQGMDAPFMQWFAERLSQDGPRVLRFEFPYMQASRADGRRRPPNPQKALLDAWRQVIAQAAPDPAQRRHLWIGGKSMGGRMASMLGDEQQVAGVICLGYPFHPPGKPDKLRTEHLRALQSPCLICQGERDNLGARHEVDRYDLSSSIQVHWIADGDHSLKPRKASGLTLEDNLHTAARAILDFIARARRRT